MPDLPALTRADWRIIESALAGAISQLRDVGANTIADEEEPTLAKVRASHEFYVQQARENADLTRRQTIRTAEHVIASTRREVPAETPLKLMVCTRCNAEPPTERASYPWAVWEWTPTTMHTDDGILYVSPHTRDCPTMTRCIEGNH